MNLILPKASLFDSYINYRNKIGLSIDLDKDDFLSKLKRERTLYGKEQRIEVWIVEDGKVIGFSVIKPTLSIEDIEFGGNLFISIIDRDKNLNLIFQKMINFIKSFYPLDRLLLTIKKDDVAFLDIVKKLKSKKFSESKVMVDGDCVLVKRFNVDL